MRLTAEKRKKLPKTVFGLPGKRGYPMDTRARAINAEARATQMMKKGKLSPSSGAKIKAKAKRRLRTVLG